MNRFIVALVLVLTAHNLTLIALGQKTDFTGQYIFKDYRNGKGGITKSLLPTVVQTSTQSTTALQESWTQLANAC